MSLLPDGGSADGACVERFRDAVDDVRRHKVEASFRLHRS
jgi:hypothetical protein